MLDLRVLVNCAHRGIHDAWRRLMAVRCAADGLMARDAVV
jgi:hypothetical protein